MKWVSQFVACGLTLALAGSACAEDGTMFDKLTNRLTFGGYFEHELVDAEGSVSKFDQHRQILFFGAQPHDRVRMFSELEIEHGGFDEVKLEQAWLEFDITNNHRFRGGIDLVPVGRLNINHDGNLRDFVLRPKVDENLIPTTWYEAGLSLNGNLADNISYTIGVSNGLRGSTDLDQGDETELRDMRSNGSGGMTAADNNNDKALWGRLAFEPALGLQFGVSGYTSRYANPTANSDSDVRFLVFDWTYANGPYEFKGEWVDIDKDQESGGGVATQMKGAKGGYVELAYHFFPKNWYESWFARGFDNPIFTALARWETLDYETPTNEDLHDRDWLTLGLNYRPFERLAFKLSYDMESRKEAGAQDRDRFGFGIALGF